MRGLSVWALLCVAGACGGDDDGGGDDGGDGATADSGSGGAADASSVADASGVADGGPPDASAPDGGGPDGAPIDASGPADGGPDASSGPGLVSYTTQLNPPWSREGNRVFFLRADDSVIDIVLTDENGRAEAMVDAPVNVVVHLIGGDPPPDSVHAFLEVPPGTDIRHGNAFPDQAATTLIATGPAPEAPWGFGLETPCGRVFRYATEPPVSVDLAFCPALIDVLWTAGGTLEGQDTMFSVFVPSVPRDVGSITVEGALRPDIVHSTRFSGLPDVLSADVHYRVQGLHGRVQEGAYHDFAPIEAGVVVVVDPLHDLRGLGLRGRASATWNDPLSETVVDVTATVSHDEAADVNIAAFVPPVLRESVLDRSTGIWTWSEDGPNTPTAIQGTFAIAGPGPERSWRVLAPRRGTSVRLPRLPPPYDGLNVAPDSSISSLQLELITHSRGYGPIVAEIEAFLYEPGEVGDVTALEYGFGDVVQ